jgi:hypothetical protein
VSRLNGISAAFGVVQYGAESDNEASPGDFVAGEGV